MLQESKVGVLVLLLVLPLLLLLLLLLLPAGCTTTAAAAAGAAAAAAATRVKSIIPWRAPPCVCRGRRIWKNMEIDAFQCFAHAWHRFGIV